MASDRPKGVVDLSGKPYPTWPFVLNKAHEMGLLSIETTLLQIPAEENGNAAIVQAVATFSSVTEGGPVRRFSGLGDANPRNTGPKIALHLIRMAETRSMGRALRAGTNIGETMWEELGGDEPAAAAPSNGGRQTPHAAARAREAAGGGSTPGFEDTYTQPGVRHYTRAELIEGTRKRLEQAKTLGISVPDHKPELMANKALFALAETLTEEIKQAKAAAAAGAEVEA